MNKKMAISAICFFVFWLGSGKAPAEGYNLHTGNGLLNICSSKVISDQNACVSYITGVFSGIAYQQWYIDKSFEFLGLETHAKYLPYLDHYCIPKTVTTVQMVMIIEKHLFANPNDLHKTSPGLIVSALTEAFPCHD